MGKGAGFWKKIKDVAKKIGGTVAKVVSWGNENLFKPIKPLLEPVVKMFDPTGIGSKVINIAGQAADWVSDQYKQQTGYTPNNTVGQFVNAGADIAMDTQRYGDDRQYNNFADYANRIVQPFNQVKGTSGDYRGRGLKPTPKIDDIINNIRKVDTSKLQEIYNRDNNIPPSGLIETSAGPKGRGYVDHAADRMKDFNIRRKTKK